MLVWKKYGDLKPGDLYRTEHGGHLYSRSGYAFPNDTLVIVDEPLPTYVPDGSDELSWVKDFPWVIANDIVIDNEGTDLSSKGLYDEVNYLIAAAPELYNVVKNVEVHLSSLSLEDDDSVASQILDLARKAIAKAEGKDKPEVVAEAKPEANETKPKKTKTEYKVVSFYNEERLVDCVNIHVSEGWILAGGVAFYVDDGKCKFAQAMTKTTE